MEKDRAEDAELCAAGADALEEALALAELEAGDDFDIGAPPPKAKRAAASRGARPSRAKASVVAAGAPVANVGVVPMRDRAAAQRPRRGSSKKK